MTTQTASKPQEAQMENPRWSRFPASEVPEWILSLRNDKKTNEALSKYDLLLVEGLWNGGRNGVVLQIETKPLFLRSEKPWLLHDAEKIAKKHQVSLGMHVAPRVRAWKGLWFFGKQVENASDVPVAIEKLALARGEFTGDLEVRSRFVSWLPGLRNKKYEDEGTSFHSHIKADTRNALAKQLRHEERENRDFSINVRMLEGIFAASVVAIDAIMATRLEHDLFSLGVATYYTLLGASTVRTLEKWCREEINKSKKWIGELRSRVTSLDQRRA